MQYEVALANWWDMARHSDNPEAPPKRPGTFLCFDHILISDLLVFPFLLILPFVNDHFSSLILKALTLFRKIVSIKVLLRKNDLRRYDCALGTWLCPTLHMFWQDSWLLEAHPGSAAIG